MKSQRNKPAIYSKKTEGLSLSGYVLIELMKAVLEKNVPFRFRGKGFSMSPFIRDGDVITIHNSVASIEGFEIDASSCMGGIYARGWSFLGEGNVYVVIKSNNVYGYLKNGGELENNLI